MNALTHTPLLFLSLSQKSTYNMYTHEYIYIYIYVCIINCYTIQSSF